MPNLTTHSDNLLSYIAKQIEQGYSSGYYPYWVLSFGKYYRSWHLTEDTMFLIAQSILLENTNGIIAEKINGKKVQIRWNIEIGEEIAY
jgi:hypothetical protein